MPEGYLWFGLGPLGQQFVFVPFLFQHDNTVHTAQSQLQKEMSILRQTRAEP